jgi:hypothetical protein
VKGQAHGYLGKVGCREKPPRSALGSYAGQAEAAKKQDGVRGDVTYCVT